MAGDGTSLTLGAGMAVVTKGEGAIMELGEGGSNVIALNSLDGGRINVDGEVNLTSVAESWIGIGSSINAKSSGQASVDITTDVVLHGGTVTAQGSAAKLDVATGIDGSGGNVTLAAGASKLDINMGGAKLSGATIDIAGMGMVNIGAPNVKIN